MIAYHVSDVIIYIEEQSERKEGKKEKKQQQYNKTLNSRATSLVRPHVEKMQVIILLLLQ